MKSQKANLQQTIEHWNFLFPYAHVPQNDEEYERLSRFVDELMRYSRHTKDERVLSLLKFVAKNLELYEGIQYPSAKLSPIGMLEFLMEEHKLSQGDLPEIGSQSLVSKILSGERQLTVEHVKNLSRRFGVSPAVFIDAK